MKLGGRGVLVVDLWSFLNGLKCAWEVWFKNLWLKTNSMLAIDLILRGCNNNHPISTLIGSIKWIGKKWRVKLTHTHRERKRLANYLAILAHLYDLGTTYFSQTSSTCSQIFLYNILASSSGNHGASYNHEASHGG